MRIRTAKDIEMLDEQIKQELGIDVKEYRNEEVVENFVEMLVFPQYVFTWVFRPFLLAIILFIIGFFILDLVHIEYLIYGLIGIFLFTAVGLLMGLIFLTWKMKSDLWSIVDYSLNIMKTAIGDIDQIDDQITKENRADVLGLLFKGVIHIVTIPVLSKVISKEVPLVGRLTNGMIKKILMLISDRISFDEENLNLELREQHGEIGALEAYSNSITTVSNGLEKILNFTFSVAQLPLKIGFGVMLLILILFVYFIN